jgi:dolichyl-phosphate beta-glucosyltransferase
MCFFRCKRRVALILLHLLLLPAVVASWLLTKDHVKLRRHQSVYRSGSLQRRFSSPSDWNATKKPRLIILIPAYNEANRLESTLSCYQEFLLQSKLNCEILVVDDGSQDETCSVVKSFLAKIPVECVSLPTNEGKGAALSRGIQYVAEKYSSTDTLIVTQDADGSGNLIYLDSMMLSLQQLLTDESGTLDWSKRALATGNRNYTFWSARGITRWGFQRVVRLIMNDLRVQDSQCGYKLMTLSAADILYKNLHLRGWSHDVEVLYRAKLHDIPIQEVSIEWKDKDGSKVVADGVARVSLQMLVDVLRLRWEYSVTGAWKE